MDSASATTLLRVAASRQLLTHPFYVRWQRGEVTRDELCAYTAQYRHFEAAFPAYLLEIAGQIEDPGARALVLRNHDDEAGGPTTHLELLDRFAASLGGVAESAPSPATRRLLDTYGELVAEGPVTGMAAVTAYEVQFPEVAAAKSEGLRRDHGLDSGGTAFWDVHAHLDVDHAAWGAELLDRLGADSAAVETAARRAADAWWAFLDERETMASTPAAGD